MATYKYVCSNNPEHLFEEATSDFWCPICDISTRPMLQKYEAVPKEIIPEKPKSETTSEKVLPEVIEDPTPIPRLKKEIQQIQEIRIGNQVWMKNFFSGKQFRNGEHIFHAKNEKDWFKAKENRIPAWCYPNNDISLGDDLGLLYNFYAVNHPDELAPEGWSIPTVDDAKDLSINYSKIFLDDHFKYSDEKTISHRLAMGSFVECGKNRIFWTKTKKVVYTAYTFSIHHEHEKIDLKLFDKNAGFFVRCIKNKSI